jgi:Stage II sporulation protein E (SpoIIE)
MTRRLLTVFAASGALLVSAGGPAAAALPTVSVPTVTVPTISTPTISTPTASVPTASVPTVTVPSVTVPSATVPSVTTGPVTTPRVTTPSVTLPSVSTPSTPPVHTPTVGSPISPPRLGSSAPPTGAGGDSSGSSAPSVQGTSASGTGSSSAGPRGGSGRSRRPAGSAAAGTGGRAGTGSRTTQSTAGKFTVALSPAQQRGTLASSVIRPPTGAARVEPATGTFSKLVKELPTAVLVALLAFAVIAAAMALNAYLQSRRAKSLAGQREALLSDVGVLQAALLPAVPANLGELDVSVAYRPAQGLAAGGDFFDVFTVSPNRTGIIIGDVSGHGRESLIHAALVRYTLRTLMGEGHSLPEVLARADRYLTGELGDGFATVVICCYEHATGELTWAKAGHEPPIIAGQPEREEQAATPLGFGMGDTWPQFSRVLAPGERVCLFTDGLTEARRNGAQLGRAHLKSLVDQGLSAQALVDRVQRDSDECSDDLAAVVMSRSVVVAETRLPQMREAATA